MTVPASTAVADARSEKEVIHMTTTTALRTEQDFHDFLIAAGFRFERYGSQFGVIDAEPWYRKGQVRVVIEDAEGGAVAIYRLDSLDGPNWSAKVSNVPLPVLAAILSAAQSA